MKDRKNIRDLDLEQLQEFCKANKLPNFRARQIWEWLWKKRATSFEEMTSLSKQLRKLFAKHFCINPVKIHKAERSVDGTIKYIFQLHDKQLFFYLWVLESYFFFQYPSSLYLLHFQNHS